LYERLTSRDGMPAAEALRLMRERHGVAETDAELEALAGRLPRRVRRRLVAEEELADVPGSSRDGEVAVLTAEANAEQARSYAALAAAVAGLPPQDRLIVKYRFEHGLQVAEIARLMRLDAKPLYRRIEGILRDLRRSLEAAGIDAGGVRGLFDDTRPGVPARLRNERNGEERPSL
jgi:DNA-directed RNA polymerase specialized sigma24 family protein